LCDAAVCDPPCANDTLCIAPNTCYTPPLPITTDVADSTTGAVIVTILLDFSETFQVKVVSASEEEDNAVAIGVGVAGGVLLLCVLVGVFVWLLRYRRSSYSVAEYNMDMDLEFSGFGKYIISYNKLNLSTKLGEGNFGEGN
jgi:hypothetical protein